MALSPNGVWYPTWGDEPVGTGAGGRLRTGAGVPDDGLGNNGDVYINITNGDVYSKSGDVWILQGAGASGSNLLGVVDPGGTVTPTAVGQFYTNTTGPTLWQAEGLTNADWRQRT